MKLWKTTIVIWTDYDPARLELDDLTRQAVSGDAYCSKQHCDPVPNAEDDPEWDHNDFFNSTDYLPTKSEMAAAKARELGLPVQELKLDRTTKPEDFLLKD